MLARKLIRSGTGSLLLASLFACHCSLWGAEQNASPQRLAQQILQTSEVQGGLVVHVGCKDGKLTAHLRAADSFLVHGLDTDARHVEAAREHVRSLGLYGKVSIDRLVDGRLPYVDGSVNLVVVTSDKRQVAGDQIARVLAPNGVAMVRGPLATGHSPLITAGSSGLEGWTKLVKPWPDDIDQWTHCLHGPDGNAIADDSVVGPPRHIQWVGRPRRARQHERLASVSAVVSAGGRLFSIEDRGSVASIVLPPTWLLVGRDALNGVQLWTRPVHPWEGHLRGFRNGPADLARRLIAVGDRVYVTLGYGKPLRALDAATGKTVTLYDGTDGTTEVLYHDGVLYLVVSETSAQETTQAARRRGASSHPGAKRVVAIHADTGTRLWDKSDGDTKELMPTSLAVGGDRVFFQNAKALYCLHAKTGELVWHAARPVSVNRPGFAAPTLVVYGDVVLSADRAAPGDIQKDPTRKRGPSWVNAPVGDLIAFSTKNGERLWSCRCREVFNAPVDVLVADGLVWTGEMVVAGEPGITAGRDPLPGEIKRRRPAAREFFQVGMPHHRCYRNRGTHRYLVLGRAGVEFIDLASGRAIPNHWIRGTCQFGILPCNGLLYVPPHSCACYTQAKLNGFYALAGKSRVEGPPSRTGERLEKGPAFEDVLHSAPPTPHPGGWPTYRCDAARSGCTPGAVSAELAVAWQAELGGRLTSVVVAENRVFVGQVDEHAVHALDTADGKLVWSYTTGARVDSPPTVYQGLAFFGSADGCVYCLRAADGALVWRFRAAPQDRRVVAYGQLESVWPVHGSVLVEDGVVYFAAGRSSYLDGGIYVYRLDARTGRQLSITRVDSREPNTGHQPKGVVKSFDLPGAIPDVLVRNGASVYMRHMRFDLKGNRQAGADPHLFCPTGLLDDSWWHRSYWILGTRFYTGYRDWFRAGREVPAGRMLVFNESSVFGFGRKPHYYYWSTPLEYHLFCASKRPKIIESPQKRTRVPQWGQHEIQHRWSKEVPLHVRAMVLAGETLFVAGPPDVLDEEEAAKRPTHPAVRAKLIEQDAALEGRKGMLLLAVSAADGEKLAEYKFEGTPVFDGLAAAAGRLYLSTTDGKVLCLAGGRVKKVSGTFFRSNRCWQEKTLVEKGS